MAYSVDGGGEFVPYGWIAGILLVVRSKSPYGGRSQLVIPHGLVACITQIMLSTAIAYVMMAYHMVANIICICRAIYLYISLVFNIPNMAGKYSL